jgi:hypothetical protein
MRICSTLAFVAFVVSGCSMFEPSTYENKSTKDGNVVTATGKAAEGAASANTSHNCPTCAPNGSAGGSGSTSNQPTRTQESTNRIVTGASDTLTNEISQGVNQAVRDVFD